MRGILRHVNKTDSLQVTHINASSVTLINYWRDCTEGVWWPLIYWKWHLIRRWLLRSIFARFSEPLLKGLVSWGSPGKHFMIDRFLGDALGVLSCPYLEYGSAVWCSAVDTHLKLLDCAVCGASWTGGVFECDLAHRLSVGVLSVLYKIRCNPMHPHYGALPVTYVPMRVTRDAVIGNRYTYEHSRCRNSQYRRTFIRLPVSLWNDFGDPVFDDVGLTGFKSRANAFLVV